jgi:2-polyprenyl-3-methyl-5-hydroxy-6-metoxy-1,4-benzoquinol methylase
MQTEMVNNFYDLAIDQEMYSNKAKLKFRLSYLFNNVSLSNKKVLDVGGGAGLLTFYAAIKGAKKVICLEPECDGSHNGMIDKFNKFKSALKFPLPVEHLPLTLQDYLQQVQDEEFDIIILHNSINHLDEEACIHLRESESSYNIYKNIFTDVYNKMKPGGKLMVTDCSCHNFFNAIGMKSYFNPTIEWHKHQTPETWIALLKEVGFKTPKVEWTSPNRLGKPGRVLMGNSLASYLIGTGFKFTMDK